MEVSVQEWVIIGEAIVIAIMLFYIIVKSGSAKRNTASKEAKKEAGDLRRAFNKRYGELSEEFRDVILKIVNFLESIEGEGG